MHHIRLALTDAQGVYVAKLARGAKCDEGEVVRAIVDRHMRAAKPALSAAKAQERQLLVQFLRDAKGNITHAALALGVHRRTLQRQIEKYAITHDEYYLTPQ